MGSEFKESIFIDQAPTEVPHDDLIRKVVAYSSEPERLDRLETNEAEAMIKELKELQEYKDYTKQRISYATFDQITALVSDEEDNAFRKKDLHGIQRLINSLKGDAHYYYESIIRVSNLQRNRFRLDDMAYQDQMQDLDTSRSRAHEALLSSARSLVRFCNVTLKGHGITVPRRLLFTHEELMDRATIGEWAFNSEVGHRIQEIIEHIEKHTKEGSDLGEA